MLSDLIVGEGGRIGTAFRTCDGNGHLPLAWLHIEGELGATGTLDLDVHVVESGPWIEGDAVGGVGQGEGRLGWRSFGASVGEKDHAAESFVIIAGVLFGVRGEDKISGGFGLEVQKGIGRDPLVGGRGFVESHEIGIADPFSIERLCCRQRAMVGPGTDENFRACGCRGYQEAEGSFRVGGIGDPWETVLMIQRVALERLVNELKVLPAGLLLSALVGFGTRAEIEGIQDQQDGHHA